MVAKSQATAAWDPRNCDQVTLERVGAGSIRALLRICQTVDAARRWPSPASSPWTRREPQVRGYFLVSNGARGGTRTHTPVRTTRFKRAAFASYATRARPPRYRLAPRRYATTPAAVSTTTASPCDSTRRPLIRGPAVPADVGSCRRERMAVAPEDACAGRGWNRRRAPIRSQSFGASPRGPGERAPQPTSPCARPPPRSAAAD